MPANVKSIQAIRDFRTDTQEYRDSLRQAIDMLTTEVARAVSYFESDRAAYWPAQVRRASDKLSEARINLERCQLKTRDGQQRACDDEKKALRLAKERVALTHEKVKATKKWITIVRREADQFKSRLAQVSYLADHDLPRAIALLERLADRLDKYAGNVKSVSQAESHPGDS